MKNTFQAWLDLSTLFLVVLGALNWGLIGAIGFNVVSWVAEHTFAVVEPLLYVLIGIAAIMHIFSRDYYLPFLGQTVYPCGSLSSKTPYDADTSITVKVEPNVNVIYWAAEPNAKAVDNPWLAYSEYENTGVTRSNEKGEAILKIRKPASYKVPGVIFDKTLKPHVHYRTCNMTGMLSRVETAFI